MMKLERVGMQVLFWICSFVYLGSSISIIINTEDDPLVKTCDDLAFQACEHHTERCCYDHDQNKCRARASASDSNNCRQSAEGINRDQKLLSESLVDLEQTNLGEPASLMQETMAPAMDMTTRFANFGQETIILRKAKDKVSVSSSLCKYQAPLGLPWLRNKEQKESNPLQACASFTSHQTCRNNNYCCWNEETLTCSMVAQHAGFDCTKVTDQIACSKIWCHVCKWHAETSTCRRAPPSTTTSLTPDAMCQTVKTYHKQAYPSTLDDEYCFVKSLNQRCLFPFIPGRNGAVANKCVSVSTIPPPRALDGPADAKWCAVVSNFDARKTKKITNSQYGICTCISRRNRPRSVVMVIMDDMRPALRAAYGTWAAKTPNIDSLTMRDGTVVFDRAYVQYAVCGPSRNSFLSGMYPETNRIITNGESFQTNPSIRDRVTLLPQMFKEAGFYTMGGGKIFHHLQDDTTGKSWDEVFAPSVEQNRECIDDRQRKAWLRFGPKNERFLLGCITKAKQSSLLDFSTVNAAKKALKKAVHNGKEPFFLAVGIYKPHTPFRLLPEFLQKFGPNTVPDVLRAQGPLPKNPDTLQYTTGEVDVLLDLWGIDPYKKKDPSLRRLVRQAYFAAISQSDTAVGSLLNRLKKLKLEESTLIILFGDHGYFLGENNLVAKNNNFEVATRAPLIMHIPWLKRAVNIFEPSPPSSAPSSPILQPDRRIFEFTEFLDILPTLASFMNISIPLTAEGLDMSNVVTAKAIWGDTAGLPLMRQATFSQISRCRADVNACTMRPREFVQSMGYTIRTDEWRFTVYLPSPAGDTDWNAQPLSVELYSHASDHENLFNYYAKPGPRFEFVETENVASNNRRLCDKLFGLIIKHFEFRRIPKTVLLFRARNASNIQMDAMKTDLSWYIID